MLCAVAMLVPMGAVLPGENWRPCVCDHAGGNSTAVDVSP